MKRRLVIIGYPFVFAINLVVSENLLITMFSSLILFITIYITELRKPNSFGTIDLIFSPLVTIWFNEYAVIYSVALIITHSLMWEFGIVEKLFSRKNKTLSNPFLVTMLVVFLVFLVTTPNNFRIIFSLN